VPTCQHPYFRSRIRWGSRIPRQAVQTSLLNKDVLALISSMCGDIANTSRSKDITTSARAVLLAACLSACISLRRIYNQLVQ
jgi:hypothetical protein